jgi:hypothetical protein
VVFVEYETRFRDFEAGFFHDFAGQCLLRSLILVSAAPYKSKILAAVFIAVHDQRFIAVNNYCPGCFSHFIQYTHSSNI